MQVENKSIATEERILQKTYPGMFHVLSPAQEQLKRRTSVVQLLRRQAEESGGRGDLMRLL